MSRGNLQKHLNRANVLAASALFGLIAINNSPELSDKLFGRDATASTDNGSTVVRKPDGSPMQICFADDYKRACADTWEEAERKFNTNPERISPTSRMFNETARENRLDREGSEGREPRLPRAQIRFAGLKYDVPENFQRAIQRATHGDPINYNVMVKVLGSESGFNNKSSHTGAFSVGQFTLSTFLETVHQHRDKLSARQRATVERNIERYNVAEKGEDPVWRYRIRRGGDAKTVRALTQNADVVTVLSREHMRTATKAGADLYRDHLETRINFMRSDKYDGERNGAYHQRLAALEHNLNRAMTNADVKIFYLCGSRGGAQLLAAMADPAAQNNRSADYTTQGVVSSNPQVFYNPDGSARSVRDLYHYIAHRVGNSPLPHDLDRPVSRRIPTPTPRPKNI